MGLPPRNPILHTCSQQAASSGRQNLLTPFFTMMSMYNASFVTMVQPMMALHGAKSCMTAVAAACRCLSVETSSTYATTTTPSRPGNSRYIGGPLDGRYKSFVEDLKGKPSRGYDYEWVVVKGGQRMLARAPAGTKRWRIWTSYEELEARDLQRQRRAQQGRMGTWLVNAGGSSR